MKIKWFHISSKENFAFTIFQYIFLDNSQQSENKQFIRKIYYVILLNVLAVILYTAICDSVIKFTNREGFLALP